MSRAKAIADLNDILSTFQVSQNMDLRGSGVEDQYLGELEWDEVQMSWRGEDVRGRMEDITGDGDAVDSNNIFGAALGDREALAVGVHVPAGR